MVPTSPTKTTRTFKTNTNNGVFASFPIIEGDYFSKSSAWFNCWQRQQADMKLAWSNNKKKRSLSAISHSPNLPFRQHDQDEHNRAHKDEAQTLSPSHHKNLAESFHEQGNKLAENGKFHEALGKWEASLTLMPDNAVLHEQKAQVLLEIGDAWNALKAATRATELEASWAEAWITLGRAQLNFGEPDSAIESFEKALAIKPDSEEAEDDKKTALHLVKRRKQLHSTGLSADKIRYVVGNEVETPQAR